MLVEKCANENEKCSCLGKVHFGVVNDSNTFSSAIVSKDIRKLAPQKGFIDCNTSEFGDPAIGQKKQCLCERPKPPVVKAKSMKKCGEEGELCKCNGKVYMGRLHSDEPKQGDYVEDILNSDKERKAKEAKTAKRKARQVKKELKKEETDKAPKSSSNKEETKPQAKKADKDEHVPKVGEGYDAAGSDPLRAKPKNPNAKTEE